MKQVVQSVRNGDLRVVDVPRPTIGPTEVLVAPSRSVLSPGTERAVRRLASQSLVGKARARPDLVRQVLQRARRDGVGATLTAVRNRLDEEMALGYSSAGVVLEVGEAVSGLRPGDRVAAGGAGHAELQVVSGRLAVAVPDGVDDEDAAFATIGSIALHGLRLADLGPGARVAVVGLGLVGQLVARIALASGVRVVALDVGDAPVESARAAGITALVDRGRETTKAVLEWSRGLGVDAVLVTAATPSSDPMARSPAIARDRAVIVVVGDVGLDLQRAPLYEKELTLRFARSYGPGRYDRSYEEWGVDYPVGYVRWTEGRNLEAFLDLLDTNRVTVADLVSHRFPIGRAVEAYAVLEAGGAALGVMLTYPDRSGTTAALPEVAIVSGDAPRTLGVGLVGAGNYARSTLVPALRAAGFDDLVAITSAGGLSARRLGERAGFRRAVSGVDAVLEDPGVGVVLIASPHDTHAEMVAAALARGKNVFVEKPLALTDDELALVVAAWHATPGVLMIGFNRRWAPAIARARSLLESGSGPLMVNYRINAGSLPPAHWYHDRRFGGRVLGEVCHFVDTCSALVGLPASSVHAVGAGRGEVILEEDVVVTLRFPDGSVAAITYAAGGHQSMPKEHIEVMGRGHSVVIDDFRAMHVDGRAVSLDSIDKGHVAELRAFARAVRNGDRDGCATVEAFATTAATLAAIESLRTGREVTPTPLDSLRQSTI